MLQEQGNTHQKKADVPIPATALPLGWTLPSPGDQARHPALRDSDPKELQVGITLGKDDRDFLEVSATGCPKRRGLFPRSSGREAWEGSKKSWSSAKEQQRLRCCLAFKPVQLHMGQRTATRALRAGGPCHVQRGSRIRPSADA